MKQINAYIQPFMADKVTDALRNAGVHGVTVVPCKGFGRGGVTGSNRDEFRVASVPEGGGEGVGDSAGTENAPANTSRHEKTPWWVVCRGSVRMRGLGCNRESGYGTVREELAVDSRRNSTRSEKA